MKQLGRWRGACVLVSLALAPPLAAQSGPAPSIDVVVTAPGKVDSGQVQRQARALTRMDDFHHEPLAQFQDPVCPGVMGLPVEFATLMVDRIRYDAERAGIKVATANDCRANILVAFVRNGLADVKTIRKKRGYLFAGISMEELNELSADRGPVHAWVNTIVRTRDGEFVRGNADAGDIPVVNAPMADSHIFLATRLDIASSVVVIDIAAIHGMSVDQIADYAAMRSLARTRPPKNGAALDTILSLFDAQGPRPAELTRFDLAYLRSINGSLANLPAFAKLGAVTGAIRKIATPSPAEPGIKR
jgi:hypothetical protein